MTEALAALPQVTHSEPVTVAALLPLSRAELDEKARALGLKLDKRTSDADLAKKIADTKARVPHMAKG